MAKANKNIDKLAQMPIDPKTGVVVMHYPNMGSIISNSQKDVPIKSEANGLEDIVKQLESLKEGALVEVHVRKDKLDYKATGYFKAVSRIGQKKYLLLNKYEVRGKKAISSNQSMHPVQDICCYYAHSSMILPQQ